MLILDCEIKKAILGRGETPIPGIEYCQGWKDFEGMGISVVCTYDTESHLTRVFLEEDFAELSDYIEGKPTAGFNTKRFDLPLLAQHGIVDASGHVEQHYDILEQIWVAQGFNPDKFNPETHGGWGLDAVCQATLGIAKTGHGALAPVWWQQGRRGKVIDYCLNDVWMEGSLLNHIIQHGYVLAADKPRVHLSGWATRYTSDPIINELIEEPQVPKAAEEGPVGTRPAQFYPNLEQPEPQSAPSERSPGGLGIIR
jgi:hypothetical protein